MTIDERLEKLTERHEGLSQTVEIMAGMQKRNDEAIAALTARVDGLAEHMSVLTRRVSAVADGMVAFEDHMKNLVDTMARLGNVVISHEVRLDRLERQTG